MAMTKCNQKINSLVGKQAHPQTYSSFPAIPFLAELVHSFLLWPSLLCDSVHADATNEAVCFLLNKWMLGVSTCPSQRAVG